MTKMQELRARAVPAVRAQLDLDMELFGICFAREATCSDGTKTVARESPHLFFWHWQSKQWFFQSRDGLVPMPSIVAMEAGAR